MKRGDYVMFREVLEPGDETLLMIVVEIRGDQALVQAQVDMPIKPQNQYTQEELMVVKL
jgi:hypothetical protein